MEGIRILVAALLGCAAVALGGAPAMAAGTELGGEPLGRVSTDPQKPTRISAGRWSTTMSVSTLADLQLVYERTQRDSSIFFGVTATSPDTSAGFDIRAIAVDSEATTCGDDNASAYFNSPFMVMGADIVVGPNEHGSRDSKCLRADAVRFEISRGSRTLESDLQLAITVVEESPLEDAYEELPGAPETDPVFTAPTKGAVEEVVGGETFDAAPLLQGGTVSETITEGQQLFYRVRLDWGQTLAAQLDTEAMTDSELEAVGGWGVDLQLVGFNPTRNDLGSGFDDTDDSGSAGSEALSLGYGLGPVRYLNRYDGTQAWAPGDYFITVSAPAPKNREPVQVPFTLTTQAQGTPVEGPGFADAEPYLIGPDQRSTMVAGTPVMGGDPDESGWFTARRLGGVGLGAVGLACLAVGALRLRT